MFTVKDRTKGLHSESVLIKVCLQLTLMSRGSKTPDYSPQLH